MTEAQALPVADTPVADASVADNPVPPLDQAQEAPPGPLVGLPSVRLGQFTSRGQKVENQDTIGARLPVAGAEYQLALKGIALAVADGVSSSAAAKVASQTAVVGFLTDYYATPDTWSTAHSATQVIAALNRFLWSQSQNAVRSEGHLTTFTAIILKGDQYFIFHVGDTRAYRLRGGALEQLTRDHSQRIDADTQYLSRALGADLEVDIDCHTGELAAGDLFLLCSDGITERQSHGDLEQALARVGDDLNAGCAALADAALRRGVSDNLSAQLLLVDTVGRASQGDALAVLSKLPFPPLLTVGQSIDGLRVTKVLYESERSQVYLVNHGDKRLVLKTPAPRYMDDPAYIERFVMEAWIGARLQHLQVARVVTPPRPRTFLYYLTEHIPGPTLAQVIRERAPLAITDAVEITKQMISGIRAFHRKDTLHQDIKPANIVIGPRGAMIVDFGSCWVAGVHETGVGFAREQALGTLDYSAPEYRLGARPTAVSDQFSLAVLLYEMLTKRHPYGAAYGAATTVADFRKLHYTPAFELNPLVPPWLDGALRKALSLDPRQRYEALSEWQLDLERPNPRLLRLPAQPLLSGRSSRFWQLMALAGWLLAGLLLVVRWLPS